MKTTGKYNLLLIHDDGATHSFRISRGALRLLLCIILLLSLVGAAGLWIGWRAWEEQSLWEQEERVLQQELTGLRLQLDRLRHIEQLVQLHESGVSQEAVEAEPAPVRERPAAAEAPGAGDLRSAEPQVGTTPEANSEAVSPQAVEAAEAQSATPPDLTPSPPPEEKPEYPVVSSGQVRLDGVSVLLVDGRRVRVRMDLHNESGRQVSGRLLLYVLTPDGHRTELVHNDPTFRISRLKKFAATSVVPESVTDLTNAMLMVEVINASSELLCRQLYPIAE